MQALRTASLSLQLPLAAAICALVVGLSVVWLSTSSSTYLQDTREAAYGEALARQIAGAVADPLQSGDLLYVRAALQRFVDSSLAEGIRISDVMDLPIGEAGNVSALDLRGYRAPILVGDDIAGEVALALELSNRDRERQQLLFSLLALVVALSMLVFVAARFFAQPLATGLQALESQLLLPGASVADSANELTRLHSAVEQLPIDMLRVHTPAPPAASDFRDATVLMVHLASLTRYVDTLSESNLHRYTRRLQQLLQAAAQCYGGELRVIRQFGLLISFAATDRSGSHALRAASCARLAARLATALEARTSLSLDLAMALDHCELAPQQVDDMYPELYLQGSVDELREACLTLEEYPGILASHAVLEDSQLQGVSARALETEDASFATASAFSEILELSAEQEALLEHQAELIVERIKPLRRT